MNGPVGNLPPSFPPKAHTSELGGRLQSNLPFYFSPPGSDRLRLTSSCRTFSLHGPPSNGIRRLISDGHWQSPISSIIIGRKQIEKKTLGLVLTVYCRIQCQKSYSHCLSYVLDWNNLSRRGKVHEKDISSKITWGLCLWRRWLHCWLPMWDEASIAALVLAARGHTLPPAKSLPMDTAQHRISCRGEASESLKWHPITSLYSAELSLHSLHCSVSSCIWL